MTYVNTSLAATLPSPVFDYTSRDYLSIISDLLTRRQLYIPEWTSDSQADEGIALLEMFAYVGDLLGYYTDRIGAEAFLQTATQPQSIYNIAGMLNYVPTLSDGASTELQITISSSLAAPLYPVDIPAGSQFSTVASATTSPALIFTTAVDLQIPGPTAATPSYVGTVEVVQGIQIGTLESPETEGVSDGSVNQAFQLMNQPVSADSLTVLVDLGIGPQAWLYVQNLLDYNGQANVYTTFVDANENLWILFGDGVNGLIPTLGSAIYATYMTNSGSAGNVGSGTITQIVSVLTGVTSVTNPAPATGGQDPESLSSIQQNAPQALITLDRAVTVNDFQILGQQVAGVQWAQAILSTYQLVDLYIAPAGGGNPSSTLIAAVQNYMTGKVMANTTVTILDPTYESVNITLQLVVDSNYGNAVTQANVETALTNLLALVNTGFGFRVSLATLYSTILGVPGVNYAVISLPVSDVVLSLNQIPTLGTVTFTPATSGGIPGS